ncbi:unnamed protein product [Cylicocyclus nassatus]|uniref:G-protein coupled receptors family 1 profile domain-containing protein n=1 Tax=Cylicocyclus nassatus TaxID=53992 RepID=A0AA36GZX4_CYLNA|nr:unnamed protein product [Cylicocyclus nassatus]
MSNSTSTSLNHTENIAVSAILAIVGIFGLLSNITAIICVRQNPVLRNGFGLLCFSHSMANLGVMLVFLLWVTPMTLLQSDLSMQLVGKVFGQINIMFWDVCVYSHLLISINRIVALTSPHRASDLFDVRRTLCLVALVWFMGFCHVIPYFWNDHCYIQYDATQWVFIFADTPCGFVISTYTDNYTSSAVLIVILVLDFTTLIKLRISNNVLTTGQMGSVSLHVYKKRRHTEIRFFMQTLYQNALFFYEMSNFYYVSLMFTNQWAVFMTSTFPWEVCHALDGFIVALFHFHFSFIGITPKAQATTVNEFRRDRQTSEAKGISPRSHISSKSSPTRIVGKF